MPKTRRLTRWQLTPKEHRPICAVLDGHTTREALAQQLCVSKRTVDSHLWNIFDKMQLETRNMTTMVIKFMREA